VKCDILAGKSKGRDNFEGYNTKRIKYLVYANAVWIHQAYDGDFYKHSNEHSGSIDALQE
jgi:hypothetical protein